MIVRKATENDVSFLSRGCQELVEHVRAKTDDAYLMELEHHYAESFPEWIRKLLEHERVLVLVACEFETLVGFVIGIVSPAFASISKIKRVGDIVACWVEPSARGKGIGRKLVEHGERWFAAQGINHVGVDYMIGNNEAEGFWRRMGYKPFRISSQKRLYVQR